MRLTWLDGSRYYTVTTAAAPGTEVLFARTGAAPHEHHRLGDEVEVRVRRAADHTFASVIEPHGWFNEAQERSEQARPRLQQVRLVGSDAQATVVEVTGEGGLRWTVMATNGPASASARHSATFGGRTYTWTGNFAVEGLQAPR